MARKEVRSGRQILLRVLFLVYAALMLWLLFGQRMDKEPKAWDNWNLIPLQTLKLYSRLLRGSSGAYWKRHAWINLVGNVILFIPLGCFLPAIWERFRSFLRCVLLAAMLIIAVELLQYATALGSCDVDDLLLNLLGTILGFGAWKLLRSTRL